MVLIVCRYYADIRQTISASDQEMNSALAELSRVSVQSLNVQIISASGNFNVNDAKLEKWTFICSSPETAELRSRSQLPGGFARTVQVHQQILRPGELKWAIRQVSESYLMNRFIFNYTGGRGENSHCPNSNPVNFVFSDRSSQLSRKTPRRRRCSSATGSNRSPLPWRTKSLTYDPPTLQDWEKWPPLRTIDTVTRNHLGMAAGGGSHTEHFVLAASRRRSCLKETVMFRTFLHQGPGTFWVYLFEKRGEREKGFNWGPSSHDFESYMKKKRKKKRTLSCWWSFCFTFLNCESYCEFSSCSGTVCCFP